MNRWHIFSRGRRSCFMSEVLLRYHQGTGVDNIMPISIPSLIAFYLVFLVRNNTLVWGTKIIIDRCSVGIRSFLNQLAMNRNHKNAAGVETAAVQDKKHAVYLWVKRQIRHS